MAGPLAGIRVLDLTAIVSGPLATMILGDQGAEVIKVEPPQIGDLTRYMGPIRNGLSAIYAGLNRNKRSVVLDLRQEEGRALLSRLAERADVLVQNFRPGAAERMGIGYQAMRRMNPELIYVSIAGFGQSGPFSQRRVYDPLIQAASGMAHAQGQDAEGGGEPQLVRSIVCDKVTALYAAQAITAALFARQRGAGGQHLELAMLDAALAFHWSDMMWGHTFLGDGASSTAELADMFRISATKDGHVIIVSGSDAEFRGCCEAFGRPELADDPRFRTLPDRMQNYEVLRDWVEGELLRRTSDEICALLDEHQVPCAKVNAVAELWGDAQVCHNGRIVEVEHPVAGRMRQVAPPVDFERTPAGIRSLAPVLGEHTDEVLAELGLDSGEMARLRAARVLG